MTVRCPLCANTLTPSQHRMAAARGAERNKRLSQELDALLQRHRTALEKAKKAAEKAYGEGFAEGEKGAGIHYRKMLDLEKLFKDLASSEPPALLAKPEAMLRGLRKRFPGDRFHRTPRGNGIIQTVRLNNADSGLIVYVCRPDAGQVGELDTRAVKTLMTRRRALAGIQVVRNVQCNSCGPGLFIICQKMALSLASVVREGIVVFAQKRIDLMKRQEIVNHLAA